MSGPYYLNPNGTFPLRKSDAAPLLVDSDEHKRLCCRWQGRVKYVAKGDCSGGVWSKSWEVVLNFNDEEVFECVPLNNSDPCDDSPVIVDGEPATPGTIEAVIGSLVCDDTHVIVGHEVWVWGDVHDGSAECTFENASQGVEAPDIGIAGNVWDKYAVYEWEHEPWPHPVECQTPIFEGYNYYQRWDCEDKDPELVYDTGCQVMEDGVEFISYHYRQEFVGTGCEIYW